MSHTDMPKRSQKEFLKSANKATHSNLKNVSQKSNRLDNLFLTGREDAPPPPI